MDQIIQSEPEFTIFTNLARRVEQGRSSLTEQPRAHDDDFSRQGFRWVTALARVELGAMLAGFSEHPTPFAAVAGTGYDLAEFKELLIDGAKLHYWALTNDEDFSRLMKNFKPSAEMLTYVRRLNVATAFVDAARGLTSLDLSAVQQEEVKTYRKQLDEARAGLKLSIALYLESVLTSNQAGTPTHDSKLVEICNSGVCRQFGAAAGN